MKRHGRVCSKKDADKRKKMEKDLELAVVEKKVYTAEERRERRENMQKAFFCIMTEKELLLSVVRAGSSFKPYVLLGMTCKYFYERIYEPEVMRLLMQSWDPRPENDKVDRHNARMATVRYNELMPNVYTGESLEDARLIALVDPKKEADPAKAMVIPRPVEKVYTLFAKRVLHLQSMAWCGMCFQGGQGCWLTSYWHLGMRLCVQCKPTFFISGVCLQQKFGLYMDTRLAGHKLVEHLVAEKVNVVYFKTMTDAKGPWKDYTTDPVD